MKKICSRGVAEKLQTGLVVNVITSKGRKLGKVEGLYYENGNLTRIFLQIQEPPYFNGFWVVEDDDPRLQDEGTSRIKGAVSALSV